MHARLETLRTIGSSLKWVSHLIHIVQIEAKLYIATRMAHPPFRATRLSGIALERVEYEDAIESIVVGASLAATARTNYTLLARSPQAATLLISDLCNKLLARTDP